LQYPTRDYIHKVLLESSNRHLIARVEHYYSGETCVQASTREFSIRKHLATSKDRSVAYNLGLIIAERSMECGITKLFFNLQDKHYTKSERLKFFYQGLCASQIEFETSTPVQLTRENIDGVNYDEQFNDVRYQPPQIQFPPDAWQEKIHYFQLGLEKSKSQQKPKQLEEK